MSHASRRARVGLGNSQGKEGAGVVIGIFSASFVP